MKGIDPALEPSVSEIASVHHRRFAGELAPATEDDLPGIVIGKDLAGEIGAMVGDTVTLLTPQGTLTPMGVMPRQRRFTVVGTFRVGLYDVDSSSGLVGLEQGMRGGRHRSASIISR